MPSLPLETGCSDETQAVGRAVAQVAEPGFVVALVGELGAGKTQFVRGMASGLGLAPRVVSSPTFVLMHEYDPGGGAPLLVHIDAYRLSGPDDLLASGWEDVRQEAITAVEWADRVSGALGEDVLEVHLTHTDRGRRLDFAPRGAWEAKMSQVAIQ